MNLKAQLKAALDEVKKIADLLDFIVGEVALFILRLLGDLLDFVESRLELCLEVHFIP